MNLIINRSLSLMIILLLNSLLLSGQAIGGDISVDYLYNLSDFNGIVPYNAARIFPDNYSEDVFVINGNRVDIYNRRGMEVFDFFLDYGNILDVAAEPSGDIIALVQSQGKPPLARCNYRGELKAEYGLSGLPKQFASGVFTSMRYRGQRLYFVDTQELKVVATDVNGAYVQGYDLRQKLAATFTAKQFKDVSFGGLDVDDEGSLFFTIPNLGSAGKLAADGTLSSFGSRGSGPGKFGVPGAVAIDRKGYVYVCDKLRSVVLVFDKTLKYVTEFGFRGFYPGNLIIPVFVAVSHDDTVYVGQLLDRGVNV